MRKKRVKIFIQEFMEYNEYSDIDFEREWKKFTKKKWKKIKKTIIDYKELLYFLVMITTLTSVFLLGVYLGKYT